MPPRLRQTLAACATALAFIAAPMLAGPSADATPALTQPAAARAVLPPIGAEIPLTSLAINSEFEYGGKSYALDFRGGIRVRVDVNPSNPENSVRLRTVGFKVTAEMMGGGTITFEQDEVDVDPKSTLTQTQASPPKYDEYDEFHFTATIEEPGHAPVVLTVKEPMVQTATLTQYPPKGDLYVLQKPVEFIDPEQPDTVQARLTKFPARRAGL